MRRICLLLTGFFLTACNILGGGNPDIPGKIVFATNHESNSRIYSMNADGFGIRRLVNWPSEHASYNPAWSPDGSQIIFSSWNRGISHVPALWIMNADGSDKRPLLEYDSIDRVLGGEYARWSPDGTKIAFTTCTPCSANFNIYYFDLLEEQLTALAENPNADEMYPAWSPDGTQIAYTSDIDYLDAETQRFRKDIYIQSLKDSSTTRLTESGFIHTPIWSPNEQVTFRSYDPLYGPSGIYQIDIQTHEINLILSDFHDRNQVHPLAWSSDGQYLLLSSHNLDPPGENILLIYNRETEKLTSIISNSAQNGNFIVNGSDWYTSF